MTSKESRSHTCKPGNWLWNIAPLGEAPDWQEQAMPDIVDINSALTLFGYEQKEFMRKQYK